MTRTSDNDFLLKKIPEDGKFIGNKALRTILNWEPEKYFRVRNRLVESGELQVGQGKGGSVGLFPEFVPSAATRRPTEAKLKPTPESKYYAPICEGLKNQWVKATFPSLTDFQIQITANRGSLDTGGVWTRPDIAVYGYGAHRFFPGRTYDLISFEIKKSDSTDVRAIFEAKGHSRRASRSFVVCVGTLSDVQRRDLIQVALAQKVGFILAADENDPESWETLAQAERVDPDPIWINDFVLQNFDDDQQRKIETWCR